RLPPVWRGILRDAIEAGLDVESGLHDYLADDPELAARNLRNFLWVTFTRSNPSHDVHGIRSFLEHKHWGCEGSLLIDARLKPHHAPPLVEDPEVTSRVDALGAKGRSLHGIL
ncbi:MAG: DUF1611 domain-containing protein, partial [Vicinamibacteria bacterium]